MKLFRSRILAAVAAFLFVASPVVAFASGANDGEIPGNGKPRSGEVGATWDGTAHRVLRSDASGMLRVTEEYPPQLQNDAYPAVDTSSVASKVIAGILRPIGGGWSVSPFGARTVLVTRVQSKDTRRLHLYLFGSDDNVTSYPIISETAWTVGGDSAKIDTLQLTIPPTWQAANTVRQFKLSLPEAVYPGRYLQLWATTHDSTVATGYQKLGITYEGRWK